MIRLLIVLCLASQTAKVEVLNLSITKPPYDKEMAFGSDQAQLSLTLQVTGAEGLIEFDAARSKLTVFRDDKGTDFLTAKAPRERSFGRSGPFGPFPKISADRKAALFDLRSGTLPAAGARTIEAEGVAVFSAGNGQETVRAEKIAFKKGDSFKAGSMDFKIDAAGKSEFGGDGFQVSLSTKDGLKLDKVRFLDAAGKEIEARPAGRSRMGGSLFGKSEITYAWSWSFKQDPGPVTVEAVLWKEVAAAEFPLKISVGVGF
jgi:hypothetical protein